MSLTNVDEKSSEPSAQLPTELVALKEKIQRQPADVRDTLEPLIDDVMEHAVFRSRVILIARDALQQFRVELAAVRLDLEATKRERRLESF
jgi:hypothetical protein